MCADDVQVNQLAKETQALAIKKGPPPIPGSRNLEEPEFIRSRIALFDIRKKEYDTWVAQQPRLPIQIKLADGRIMPGESWTTTPMLIAKTLGTMTLDDLVVAKVNGELYDLSRPLEKDCTLEFLTFDDPEGLLNTPFILMYLLFTVGRSVFWHSSAHILGEACEKEFACHLCFGPPTEDGFHYDSKIPKDEPVTPNDFKVLEAHAHRIQKEKQKFERLELSKEDLLAMFAYNPYKVHFISEKVPDGTRTTVYRCGPLIDLCLGPHVPHTGKIQSFKVTKVSSSYFLGDASQDSLQRVYGISFPSSAMMQEYLIMKAEAEKRDHRRLGKEDSLFFFHEWAPGSCFFLPNGARIYNTLVEFIRSEYRKRGFQEVITPNMFNTALWKTSGHYQNYYENMFLMNVDKEEYALKPMNCPGHCLIFGHRDRSYKELPLRLADFGVLHRNELSGALGGLTRVRRFAQDDAHIFCRKTQIKDEIRDCINFMDHVYSIFGFSYSLRFSTRPEKYLGDLETWNFAEAQLEQVLNESGKPWELNPGDGAFYGPKIDVSIMDAQKRRFQCATIQLDFQLPIRFNLHYRAPVPEGTDTVVTAQEETPVIIHRAVLGSLERMIAILTENFSGQFPFWLSPRQMIVVPVSHATDAYAQKVYQSLHDAGFHVEIDSSDLTFNKKIRNAETSHISFILVVGAQEEASESVNIRKASKDQKDVLLPLKVAIEKFSELKQARVLNAHLE